MPENWAYYNDNDSYVCEWTRNLIKAGLIMDGVVDERPIEEVQPDDLKEFVRCHFFCGIATWDYALSLAGWNDNRGVTFTGSCPCQPFSAAGRKGGLGDERHLWPHWARLISECKPDVIFGEQVASADGLAWLDFVCADLETAGYSVGAVDTCAAGFGAPHIRQRLYFVAESECRRREGTNISIRSARQEQAALEQRGNGDGELADSTRNARVRPERRDNAWNNTRGGGTTGELADSDGRNSSAEGLQRSGEHGQQQKDDGAHPGILADSPSARPGGSGRGSEAARRIPIEPEQFRVAGDVGDTDNTRSQGHGRSIAEHGPQGRQAAERHQPTAGFWHDAHWLRCIDGKARATQPGIFPLVNGYPNRVGILRAAGNAIVPQQAAEFIKAYMECRP